MDINTYIDSIQLPIITNESSPPSKSPSKKNRNLSFDNLLDTTTGTIIDMGSGETP